MVKLLTAIFQSVHKNGKDDNKGSEQYRNIYQGEFQQDEIDTETKFLCHLLLINCMTFSR